MVNLEAKGSFFWMGHGNSLILIPHTYILGCFLLICKVSLGVGCQVKDTSIKKFMFSVITLQRRIFWGLFRTQTDEIQFTIRSFPLQDCNDLQLMVAIFRGSAFVFTVLPPLWCKFLSLNLGTPREKVLNPSSRYFQREGMQQLVWYKHSN